MSILSVANVHFESTGTNRMEYLAGNNDLRIVSSNISVISSNVSLISSNDIYLTPTTGNTIVSGTVTATNFNSLSDQTLKTDVKNIENSTEKVEALKGVTFTWKDTGQKSIGFIAQEVEAVIPELVSDNKGIKSINYDGLTALLVETIKELKTRIEKLENNK